MSNAMVGSKARREHLRASMPTPGLYWARLDGEGWRPVEVDSDGWVWIIGSDMQVGDANDPFDWSRLGPELEPPGSVPVVPSDAHPLLYHLAREIEDIDGAIAKLNAKRVRVETELREKLALEPTRLPPMHAETCAWVGGGKWECVAGCTMTPDDITREESAKWGRPR